MPAGWYSHLADLPLRIERCVLEGLSQSTAGAWTRHTTLVRLQGAGHEGVGEDVTYPTPEQLSFQQRGPLPLEGTYSFDAFTRKLDSLVLFPDDPVQPFSRLYRRWAVESAALDLALRQAGESFAGRLGLSAQPVRFCVSLGLGVPPSFARVDALRARVPGLEFKLDYDESWQPETVEELAARGCAQVVDYKGHYSGSFAGPRPDAEMYGNVARELPDVYLEDPLLDEACAAALAPHRARISWDAPLHSLSDVLDRPFMPRCINIKPSRFGRVAELLRVIEFCQARGIAMYGGGQFELGPGRGQNQLLASLFYPEGPNDVAPSLFNQDELPAELPSSPLAPKPTAMGFGWE